MNKTLKLYSFLLLSVSLFFLTGCKKEAAQQPDLATVKRGWLTGTWKQKDIQLGVSTKVPVPGGGRIPLTEGMSMLDDPTINMLLEGMAGVNPFIYTRNNTYSFNSDGSYSVDGIIEFPGGIKILAGAPGTWDTQVFSSVLELFPEKDVRDPHWINSLTSSKLNLAITVALPGLGDVPMKLILEK